MRRKRLAQVLLLSVLILAWLVGPPSRPAAQAATGDLTITGHGFGHGRGLSQWGAYGYATGYGWSYLNILAHYYSNATVGDIGNPAVTVRLTAQDGIATQVYSGQTFDVSGWLIPPGTVAQISLNPDNTWQLTTLDGCNGKQGGSIVINDPAFRLLSDPGDDITKMLSVCGANVRTYRGALYMAWDGSLHTVDYLSMQEYLRGVVPRESPASWGDANGGAGMNALMAQAVAARSYAQSENRYSYAKTCDTTACQVYGGAGLNGAPIEDPRSDRAVSSTAGQAMMLNGQVARTEFSSSSGGYTAGGTFPAVPDLGDSASPYHNWSVTVRAAQVSSAFGVGALQSVTVLSRNGLGADGGRVTKVRVAGSTKTVDVTGSDFRSALGLKSDWFSVTSAAPPPVWGNPINVDLSPVQVAAVRTGYDSVVTFVRGLNNTLWVTTAVNGIFDPFVQLPGAGLSGMAAVSSDSGRIDLFVVGLDKALWHTWTVTDGSGRPTTWAPWESLGGTLTSGPMAASNEWGKLVVVGRDTLGGAAYRIFDGTSFGPWQTAGGAAITEPVAEVYSSTDYRIRVVGLDGNVWTRLVPSDGSPATADWTSTGRSTTFAPAVSGTMWWDRDVRAAAWPNGHGGVTQEREATGLTVDIGGGITSVPALVELRDGNFWTFVRGLDNALWVNMSSPTGTNAWYRIGGYLA